jgi:hypothetical protein
MTLTSLKREGIIKMAVLEVGYGAWIGFYLVRDRNRMRALVKAAMTLRVP